jgi:hypothetical protein
VIATFSGSRGLPPLDGTRRRRPLTPNIITAIHHAVDNLAPGSFVYQGLCSGVDLVARARAVRRGLGVRDFPAQWELHGKRAGLVRNTEMAESDAEVLFAFAVAGSSGTMHCVREFLRLGKGFVLHEYDADGNFLGFRTPADFA